MNYLTILVGVLGALVGAFFSIYSAVGIPLFVIFFMWGLAYRYKSEAGMIPAILLYYVLPPYVLGVCITKVTMFIW